MHVPLEQVLLAVATLLLLSIFASKVSVRLGIPSLLLFLLIGMLAGSDGPGGIYFDDFHAAETVGLVALSFILFAGGLEADWKHMRPVLREGLLLSTLGVFITAGLVALFVHWVLDVSLLEGVLVGAIVAPTDAAAVFSILRPRSSELKNNLTSLLELESGTNDPMAILLTVSVIRVLTVPTTTITELVVMLVQQIIVGAVVGYLLGRLMVFLINRLRLESDGLYPVLTVAFVFLVYGATTLLGGNAFLSIYLVGLVMGNQTFVHKNSLIEFHNGLAWIMQIGMFLVLGLLVFPSQLPGIAGAALAVSAFLMLVARPASVFVSLAFSGRSLAEKLLVSWVGLRGAVPIVLAIFPLIAGIPDAHIIFHLVFFVVLTSILVQGMTLPSVARLLRVETPKPPRYHYPIKFVETEDLRNALLEVHVPPNAAAVGKQILALGLPDEALIVLVARGDEFIVPRGSLVIEAGDTLLILTDQAERDRLTGHLLATS